MRIPALPKDPTRIKREKKEQSWIKSLIARVTKRKFYRLPIRK